MILADSVLRKGVRRPNGHEHIVDSLADIVELGILKSGDLMWLDERWSWGIELKTPGNVMVSMVSINQETGLSQLDYQMMAMEENYDVPVLMVYGVYSSSHDGFLVLPGFPETGWRYNSVEGKLFSYSMRGIIVVKEPSEQAAAQVIRGLYEGSQREPRPGTLKKARLFGFRKKPDEALRPLCALPGINEVLGRRVRQHFKTLRRAMAATSWAEVEGIGEVKDGRIQRILDEEAEQSQGSGEGTQGG